MKKISLLGATGSIGTQTLDVITLAPRKFQSCCVFCWEKY